MFSALIPQIGPIGIEPDLIVIKQNFTIRVRVTEESAALFYVKNYSGEISAGQKNYPMWGDETIKGAFYVDGTRETNGNGTLANPYNDLFLAMDRAGENGTVVVIGDVILE